MKTFKTFVEKQCENPRENFVKIFARTFPLQKFSRNFHGRFSRFFLNKGVKDFHKGFHKGFHDGVSQGISQ